MKKFVFKISIVVLVLCLSFAFTGTALAYSNKEYIDADTALKLYTELYAKYYPGENIVSIDSSKYVPVESSIFYEGINTLEQELKESVLPENNVKVEYDEEGRIIRLQYTDRFKEYAQEYIGALSKQLSEESEISMTDSDISTTAVAATTRSNKTVWGDYHLYMGDVIPWHPTCYIGYVAKFYVSNSPNYHFTQRATNFNTEVIYSGAGSCTASFSVPPTQSLLDLNRTDAVSVRISYTATITVEGITFTHSDILTSYHEFYAISLW